LGRKKKAQLPDGTPVEGTVIPFQTGGEHWNEYLVEDGSIIRAKLVATEVIRVDGRYDEQGNPMYVMHTTQVLWVDSPHELRREEGQP
jgi:hypothetical protein